MLASTLAIASTTTATADTAEFEATDHTAAAEAAALTPPENLTQQELAELGISRNTAEQATADFNAAIDEALANQEITASEAEELRQLGADGPQEPTPGMEGTQALPVWAAAAIVGCAAGAVTGEGKTQIKKALQNGASVDQATDIAVGAAVDCVFGAVPFGAIGAAAKKALAPSIKSAVKPVVREGVEKITKE